MHLWVLVASPHTSTMPVARQTGARVHMRAAGQFLVEVLPLSNHLRECQLRVSTTVGGIGVLYLEP